MVGWLKDFIADFIIAALIAATILVSAITWLPSLYEPEAQNKPQQSGQTFNAREGLVSWEGLIGLSNFEAPRDTSVKTALPANRVVQRGSKSKLFDSEPMTLSGEEMSGVLNSALA